MTAVSFIPFKKRVKSYFFGRAVRRDFPGGASGKKSACNAGDLDSIPGLGRCPGEGNGNPLQYSCLENSMNREGPGRLQSMKLQRVRLSD